MTPDTTDYMLLGFILTAILLLGLVAYLVIKAHNLRTELKMLETLEAEGHMPAEARTTRDSATGA